MENNWLNLPHLLKKYGNEEHGKRPVESTALVKKI